MKHVSAALIVFAGLGLYAHDAHASVCAQRLAELETTLGQSAVGGGAVTGTESLNAKLHHQPTPASVNQAKKAAQTKVSELLEQARDFDAKGESSACMRILKDVRSLADLQ